MPFPLPSEQVDDSFVHGLFLMCEDIRIWLEEKRLKSEPCPDVTPVLEK